MKKKISYFLFILFLILGVFFIYRSCTKIPIKELETLHNELKASDRNIKSIQFYFRRPDQFCTEIVYHGEISDWGLMNIISHFKEAITYDFLIKYSNKYMKGYYRDEPNKLPQTEISIYRNFVFADIPQLYDIDMTFLFSGSEKKKSVSWKIRKNYIDPNHYNKIQKVYNSYINRFRILIGGTILIPLLCILFFKYRKWKRY